MAEAATPKRPPREPIPVTVLTGFLGAGKTTLLNRLVTDPALAHAAVIINEFGEVGLDHLFVARADEGIVELSSGCLCCTVRGELVSTLEDLLRRLDNGRLARLDRVVIETTGLADPAPVLHAIMLHPYLVQRYRLDGVVTVIDAVNGMATLDAHPESVKQAAVADRLVLTKTDIAEPQAVAALKPRLAALNPGALQLDAAAGEATPAALIESGLWRAQDKTADVRRWLAEEAYLTREPAHGGHDHHHQHHHGHHHRHGGAHHHHDVNRHDDSIRAFALSSDAAIAPGAFEMFLELLRSAHGPKLLRVKGIVRLSDDEERPVVIHGVQHVFHPPVRLAAWPDADRRSRLVFITKDLPEGFVRRMFEAFTGAVRPDTPDAAALTDNPLAIAGFGSRTAG